VKTSLNIDAYTLFDVGSSINLSFPAKGEITLKLYDLRRKVPRQTFERNKDKKFAC